MSLTAPNRYEIRSDILYELLTYGDGLDHQKRIGLGNWPMENPLALGVLTYLALRAFSIHRLPWHSDRHLAKLPNDNPEKCKNLAFLEDPITMDAVCSELRELYSHAQEELRDQPPLVKHSRSLLDGELVCDGYGRQEKTGYATLVTRLDAAATKLGRKEFHVEMDVLNSWGSAEGSYTNRPVVIRMEVPKEDILITDSMLASRPANDTRDAMESGEWIVLNRSSTGVVALPCGCLEMPSNMQTQVETWVNRQSDAELVRFLDDWRYHMRPAYSQRREGHVGRLLQRSPMQRLQAAWHVLRSKDLVG